MQFSSRTWIDNAQNIIITGPTGTGKTYIAEAIGLYVCKIGMPVKKYATNGSLKKSCQPEVPVCI